MKNVWKKLWAGILSVAMLCALLPAAAFADGEEVTIEFGHGDNYYDDERLELGYLSEHPGIVTTPEDFFTITVQEGGNVTLPKAETVDMTEEEKNDTKTKPYFYVRNSNGEIETKMVCEKIALLGKTTTEITTETNKPFEYTVPAHAGSYRVIMYYWYKETPPEPHKVTYDYNVGTGTYELPAEATIYPGELLGEDTTTPYPNFTQKTVTDGNPAVNTQVEEKRDYTVYGDKPTVNGGPITDLIARSGNEIDGYTYYEFLGWKSSADGKIYHIGDTATMGEEDVTYTAQWQRISEDTWDTERFEKQGISLPLTVKYSDSDYPDGTDAQITQKSTSGNFGRVNDTADDPLLLDDDRKVSYTASMKMSPLVAKECLSNQDIKDPEFANFDIHVQIGDNLTVLDQNGTVDFSFTCTFLEPTGEVRFGDDKQGEKYTYTTEGNTYNFSVPAEEFTSNSFVIPVKWKPGSYSDVELQTEITLQVANAQIDTDYTGVVKTSGYITGSIDFSLVADSLKLYKVASLQLGDSTWKKVFDEDGDGRISVKETAVAYQYIENYAKDNILLNANSVYAQYRPEATIQPADMTIYMGGDNGYEGVTDANGTIQGSNSLPEPGYYITLPDEVNQALKDAGLIKDDKTPADLSKILTIYTMGVKDSYKWTLVPYGNTYSAANNKYIYAVVPEDEEKPFRLTFTDKEGNTFDSDTFNPAEAGALHQKYTMKLYPGLIDSGKVVIEVAIPEGKTFYCTAKAEDGILDVRYVTGNQDSVVTPAYDSVEEATKAEDANQTALKNAYVIPQAGTDFYINNSNIDVTEGGQFAQVSLLFDDVINGSNTEGVSDYSTQLIGKAVNTAANGLVNVKTQAKYLDLVDSNNGNVWLKPSKAVTVYWPYPAGTDASTDFRLVHFEGLDRDMGTEEVAGQIASTPATTVELKKDAYGISFTTDSFSPFVLVWGDQPAEEEDGQPSQTPAPTAAPTAAPAAVTTAAVIPQTGDAMPVGLLGGVAIVAAAAFVALLVLRKRKHND